jgi:hypothetical protein
MEVNINSYPVGTISDDILYLNIFVFRNIEANVEFLEDYIYDVYRYMMNRCFGSALDKALIQNSTLILTSYSFKEFTIADLPTDENMDEWMSSHAPFMYRLVDDGINTYIYNLVDICKGGWKDSQKYLSYIPLQSESESDNEYGNYVMGGMLPESKIKVTNFAFTSSIDFLFQEYMSESLISVGVEFTNPYYIQTINLLTKAGFGNPSIKRRLYVGDYHALPFLMLTTNQSELEKNRNETIIKYNIEISETIKNNYEQMLSGLAIDIVITKNTDTYIRDTLMTLLNETGTGFVLEPMSFLDKKYKLRYVCRYEERTIPVATSGQTVIKSGREIIAPGVYSRFFAHVPPNVPINMHTHPFICIDRYMCEYAWPSFGDLVIEFKNAVNYAEINQPLLTLVSSPEGYYITQETNFFIKLAQGLYTFKNVNNLAVMELIVFFVSFMYNSYMNQNKEYTDKIPTLQLYISMMNKFSVHFILDFIEHILKTMVDSPVLEIIDRMFTWLDFENGTYYDFAYLLIYPDIYRNKQTLYAGINSLPGMPSLDTLRTKPSPSSSIPISCPSLNGLFDYIRGNKGDIYFVKNVIQEYLSDIFPQYKAAVLNACNNIIDKQGRVIPNAGLEPTLICNFIDDFIKNPLLETTTFRYYNHSDISGMQTLQQVASIDRTLGFGNRPIYENECPLPRDQMSNVLLNFN